MENISAQIDRQKLVTDHLTMAERMWRKAARSLPRAIDRDDLRSAALLGLVEAAQKFDPTRTPVERFPAYACRRIHGAVYDYLRELDCLSRGQRAQVKAGMAEPIRVVSLNAMYHAWENNDEHSGNQPANLDEILAWPERPRDKHAEQRVEDVLALLEPRYREILSAVYLHGMTGCALAARMGVAPSRVSQLINEAIRIVRERVGYAVPA